ncbi:AbrB/MazE/SpoVT family DNA-binding domain-containing protein [Raoultibacter phocaeensis]|uniref:AbrB/MazE/SpoVT family DNA-binding domain-containing protein n=1 Tax=Raoultibacter phocaeensis TaxID=2479841 RepID=UPI0015D60828|nr:AbrB/MazE/SpoVT family DNA-binding domain-containing protein [Raoultibacter phocaeensis]
MAGVVAEKTAKIKAPENEAAQGDRSGESSRGAAVKPLVRKISSKGQVSIPKAWLESRGFNEYATIVFTDEGILVKPVELSDNDEFDALILRELIAQGLEGDELVDAWAAEKQALREGIVAYHEHILDTLDEREINPDLDDLFGC